MLLETDYGSGNPGQLYKKFLLYIYISNEVVIVEVVAVKWILKNEKKNTTKIYASLFGFIFFLFMRSSKGLFLMENMSSIEDHDHDPHCECRQCIMITHTIEAYWDASTALHLDY